jgi:hypothetical protein
MGLTLSTNIPYDDEDQHVESSNDLAMRMWHECSDETVGFCSGLSPGVKSTKETDDAAAPALTLSPVKSSAVPNAKHTNDEDGRARISHQEVLSVPCCGQENIVRKGISSKILEKTEWFSQLCSRGESLASKTLDKYAVKPTMNKSTLVADRLAWLQKQGTSSTTSVTTGMEAPMPHPHSQLVADRKRLILQTFTKEESPKVQDSRPSKDCVDPSLVQGLASSRAKWLNSLTQDHTTKTRSSEAMEKQKHPGKLQMREIETSFLHSTANTKMKREQQPQRLRFDQQANFLSSIARSYDCRKPSQTKASLTVSVSGSLAEKRARFLDWSQKRTTTPAAQPSIAKKMMLCEPKLSFMDQMVESLNFFEHVMIELEQEGLLPSFIAEHTTWLFGGFLGSSSMNETRADNTVSIMHQLPLHHNDEYDYDALFAMDLRKTEEPTQSTEKPQSQDTEVFVGAETTPSGREVDVEDVAPSHPQEFVQPPSLLSQHGPLTLEQTKWQDIPWCSMTYEEAASIAICAMTSTFLRGWHSEYWLRYFEE